MKFQKKKLHKRKNMIEYEVKTWAAEVQEVLQLET